MKDTLPRERARCAASRFAWARLGAMIALICAPVQAAHAARVENATTSRKARNEAIAAIPIERLTADNQSRIRYVLENTGIYRRLPVETIDCDPHLYLFLLQNPEVVTGVWKAMGISRVELQRVGTDMFRGSDGQGTTCHIKIAYQSPQMSIIYAEGHYDGPLLKHTIDARCVLLLRSHFKRGENGRYHVTGTLDTFTQIDRGGLELMAKAFQPLIGRAADINFTESMGFISSLSRTAEINPGAVSRIAQRLQELDQTQRDRLALLAAQMAERSSRDQELRQAGHAHSNDAEGLSRR